MLSPLTEESVEQYRLMLPSMAILFEGPERQGARIPAGAIVHILGDSTDFRCILATLGSQTLELFREGLFAKSVRVQPSASVTPAN